MSVIEKLLGVVPPLVTPLTDDHKIDEAALRRIVSHVIDGGNHVMFVMGSTGEFAAFSRVERRLAIEIVVDETAGRVPVLAGVCDSGTDLTARNARDAESAGADAVVATIPYYFPSFTDASVSDHFRYIAESVGIPLVIYNVPQYVKGVVKVETIVDLAEKGIAAAVKDSSGDFSYFQELLFRTSHIPGFRVLQGDETAMGASLLMGADGIVPGIANLCPEFCVQIYEAGSNGRAGETRILQERLNDLRRIYKAGHSFVGSLKSALSMAGLCGPTTTRPIPTETSESAAEIRKIIENFNSSGETGAVQEVRDAK